MKIELDTYSAGQHIVTAYAAGTVSVGGTAYTHNLIVTPQRIIEEWAPVRCAGLTADHVERIAELDPEVVLLGTGIRTLFPPPQTLKPLTSRGIGLEIMDTGAACRAYNFLVGEGRRVAAALFMIETEPP